MNLPSIFTDKIHKQTKIRQAVGICPPKTDSISMTQF